MLLPADLIAGHLGLLGITPETTVVIMPSDKLQDATLVGIALERVGHLRYAILDGGWEKWGQSSGRSIPAFPPSRQRPIRCLANRMLLPWTT